MVAIPSTKEGIETVFDIILKLPQGKLSEWFEKSDYVHFPLQPCASVKANGYDCYVYNCAEYHSSLPVTIALCRGEKSFGTIDLSDYVQIVDKYEREFYENLKDYGQNCYNSWCCEDGNPLEWEIHYFANDIYKQLKKEGVIDYVCNTNH